MKGDFSRWRTGTSRNFNGILPQQGKMLLDSDGIAQAMLANDWQQTAARDWVGMGAGVPQSQPNSFMITNAALPAGGDVTLTVDTGRIWADGLLVRLVDASHAASVSRTATWLGPPIVPNQGSTADVAEGVVDTVVLEVWQCAVNGFSIPDALMEPALGGPDTAERLQTECAFRLARLAAGQTCSSLKYDESSRGTLNASLVPTVTISGDCPLEAIGGYSGFEHQLYRIEIADASAAFKEFKWSRVNAGLVGRGAFDPTTQAITIDANAAAINSYSNGENQTGFYLEIEQHDSALGYTRVIAGASATLNAGVLQLTATPHFGNYPTAAGDLFFRLWDGIAALSAYPVVTAPAAPTMLESGIQLQFAAEATASYFPGDYWMFPVRAQGIANPGVLINSERPQGIRYHRVPLAEITWTSDGAGGFIAGTIEDCREPMHPITQTQGCCTHRVGDGVDSFGEFTSIQDAIDALPDWGGEICILPGRYYENVVIYGRKDVVIHGCGWQTRVASASLAPNAAGTAPPFFGKQQQASGIAAVFTVINSAHIQFRSFAIEAAESEAGILIDGEELQILPQNPQPRMKQRIAQSRLRRVVDTTIEDMVITAAQAPAIVAVRATQLVIAENRVVMSDERSSWPALFVSGSLIYIERNVVTLAAISTVAEFLPGTVAGEVDLKLPDAKGELLHPGGIQIGGPSANVNVRCNEIVGGSRNGVTLGSLIAVDANQNPTGGWIGVVVENGDNCCTGGLTVTGGSTGGGGVTYINAGPLTNIHIEENIISSMGLCGIGPVAYFDLAMQFEVISIEGLSILGNTITDTVRRAIDISNTTGLAALMGIGAITVPDVASLVIRDNAITNFGENPGVQVSGIFILFCEGLEIARNRILETRDRTQVRAANTNAHVVSGGIIIMFATPPTGSTVSLTYSKPVHEPGVPAVRLAENTVRVTMGQGLFLVGTGPVAIVNNHFATGGTVAASSFELAQTVCVLDLGKPIELGAAVASNPSSMSEGIQNGNFDHQVAGAADFSNVTNGTVLFTNNVCQLEARESGQSEIASVFVYTPDSLIFSNNATWLDAARLSAWIDVLLLAFTVQATGNRLQEPVGAVILSGFTIGAFNITAHNISTACLLALPASAVTTGNIVLLDAAGRATCTKVFGSLAVANT